MLHYNRVLARKLVGTKRAKTQTYSSSAVLLLEERRIVGQPVAFDLSLGKDTRHRAGMPSPLPLMGWYCKVHGVTIRFDRFCKVL